MLNELLKRFWEDQSGSPAVEYSMIATLIGVALLAVFGGLGDAMVNLFNGNEGSIGSAMSNAVNS